MHPEHTTAVTGSRDGPVLQLKTHLDDATRLIELGARVGLVVQLTGLEKTTVLRLFREVNSTPPNAGQSPYTDTWYRQDDVRMLHATIVWRLHKRFKRLALSDAELVIKTFEAYRLMVEHPQLDLTHTAFVPQLVATDTWHERVCTDCGASFLAPNDAQHDICPGCRIYYSYRCGQCGSKLPKTRGRRRMTCSHCGARRVDDTWIA